MNSAERREAIAAGEKHGDECVRLGRLMPFDVLVYVRLIGNTADADLLREQMRLAECVAQELWAKRGGR